MPGNDNLTNVIQIIFGLVVLILIYVVTLVVLNIDSLVASKSIIVKPRETTLVIDGWANASPLSNRSYNTINPFVDDFRKIGKSVNSHGGAQFTYQFWIKIEDINPENFKNRVLLMKGDTKKYKVGLYDFNSRKLISKDAVADYMIKSPLIKFGDSYKDMIVEFNTNKNIKYSTRIKSKGEVDPIARRNALSLLPLNWYLFTFVFEDNFSPMEVTENGIKFTFYLNDFPYHSVNGSTDPVLRDNALKQNEGGLHVLPGTTTTGDFIKLANIKYMNYAVSQKEISDAYAKGPPKHSAILVSQNIAKPSYLTAYNKMDIYNY